MMAVSAALRRRTPIRAFLPTMRYELYITDSGARFRTVCAQSEVVMLDRGESHIHKMKAERLDRLKSSKGIARR